LKNRGFTLAPPRAVRTLLSMVAFAADYAPTTEAPDAQNRARGIFLAVEVRAGENGRESRHPRREKAGLSYETASGPTNFLNRDPIEEEGGLNLYAFVGNDPVNHWDYLGLDFIAVGTRRLQRPWGFLSELVSGALHSSIYYFEYCGEIEMGKPIRYSDLPESAEKIGFYELLGELWYERLRGWPSPRSMEDIRVSVVYDFLPDHSRHADTLLPIWSDQPELTKEKWETIENTANNYRLALHYSDGPPPKRLDARNWPWVKYERRGNNSNTFIRYLVRSINLESVLDQGFVEHEGNRTIQRPTDRNLHRGYPTLKEGAGQ